ncbi:YicC family protein [Halobacillus yeomjeoni]|nr:YicC family protein [Halobacillus yeomjeoni]
MVNSMTGYGKGSAAVDDTELHVELRSVNHRFLDISSKMPRSLLFLEDQVKSKLRESLSRGRVDVYVTIEGHGLFDKKVDVDWTVADQYFERLKEMKARYNLTGDLSIDMVSRLENVFSIQEIEEDTNELQQAFQSAFAASLDQLVQMRAQEGKRLLEDLQNRIKTIETILAKLEERRPEVVQEYKDRIRARIEEYTQGVIQPDDARILQEVGVLAEKGDVTEEITRLHSHTSQFSKTLSKQEPVGRRLDFIVQEMHREVNTIGSKSNDSEVTKWVVDLKSEIEKIKEQVQNVE